MKGFRTWTAVCAGASALAFSIVLFAQTGFPPPPPRVSPAAGAIDIHVHSDPDAFNRSLDDFDIARIAARKGMRGIVLKNHVAPTAARAALIMRTVPGIEVWGGIALNRAVGGVNPLAVEWFHRMSGGRGKVVWLPTFDADNQHKILNDIHGPQSYWPFLRSWRRVSFADIAKVIKEVGAAHFILSSDLGQNGTPTHPDGMEMMVNGMKREGLSQADIDLVVMRNPARFLGLES